LSQIVALALPGSMYPLLQVNRRFRSLFDTALDGASGNAGQRRVQSMWRVALQKSYCYPFIAPAEARAAKQQLQLLSSAAAAARNGTRWRFCGYEREVFEGVAVEHEFKLEVDSIEGGMGCHLSFEAVIWWKKTVGPAFMSAAGIMPAGMGSWQPEKLAVDSFNMATGELRCHGIECGAGLGLARYRFVLGDRGLSVTELGEDMLSDHGCLAYTAGLAQHPAIPDPVAYVRQHNPAHFPPR
jgi:hypothetical protein